MKQKCRKRPHLYHTIFAAPGERGTSFFQVKIFTGSVSVLLTSALLKNSKISFILSGKINCPYLITTLCIITYLEQRDIVFTSFFLTTTLVVIFCLTVLVIYGLYTYHRSLCGTPRELMNWKNQSSNKADILCIQDG